VDEVRIRGVAVCDLVAALAQLVDELAQIVSGLGLQPFPWLLSHRWGPLSVAEEDDVVVIESSTGEHAMNTTPCGRWDYVHVHYTASPPICPLRTSADSRETARWYFYS